MCAVVMKVGGSNTKFVNLACINIVLASNAGGIQSIWGYYHSHGMASWSCYVYAVYGSVCTFGGQLSDPCFHYVVVLPKEQPDAVYEQVEMKRGARRIVALFILPSQPPSLFMPYSTSHP